MPKLQGKQIADETLTQKHLNLVTPNYDDTLSGATVEYVNDKILSVSGSTFIGEAEDTAGYTDGIFTDFSPETPVGTAVDRFNEMFLLLAPAPPSDSWVNKLGSISMTSTDYSAAIISTTTNVSHITNVTSPIYAISDTVSGGAGAVSLPTGSNIVTFEVTNEGIPLETVILDKDSVTKTTAPIKYTVGDAYAGQDGKSGFWDGVISMTIGGSIPTVPPSVVERTIGFTHPDTPLTVDYKYYVNVESPSTPTVNAITTGAFPEMTKFISGVPTYIGNGLELVSNINTTVSNAVSYFYNLNFYTAGGAHMSVNGSAPSITTPTTLGQDVSINDLVMNISTNSSLYSNTRILFSITARNASGGSNTKTYTQGDRRIDRLSNESERLMTSGIQFPLTVGSAYTSTESALSLKDSNTTELQLVGGKYRWPLNYNYSSYLIDNSGVNYVGISTGVDILGDQVRWATFSLGNLAPTSNFKINFSGSNLGTNFDDVLMYVKVGDSGWLDATIDKNAANAQSVEAPYENNDSALQTLESTTISRKITFGTIPRAGEVFIRIAIKSSDSDFYFTKPTLG